MIHGRVHGAESLFDPRRVHLADLGLRLRERFLYEYDFTDGWQHDVRVEQILPLEGGRVYSTLCGWPARRAARGLRWRLGVPRADIADQLYALAERRLAMGNEAKRSLTITTRTCCT